MSPVDRPPPCYSYIIHIIQVMPMTLPEETSLLGTPLPVT
jgi:hypothetical protein